jgi:hypothetical protein
MSNQDARNTGAEPPQDNAPYIPASTAKRIWAWMGVVYAVIILALITYWIATSTFLTGLTGLMLFPLTGALCAQGINNARLQRKGQRSGNFALLLLTAILMGLVALACLGLGIRELIAIFIGG